MKNLNRIIIGILTALVVGWIIWYFSDIISYLIIAWVLSLVGQPIMRFLQKIKIKKFQVGPTLAAALTLGFYLILISSFFALFAPLIFMQASNLASVDYSAIARTFEGPIRELSEKFGFLGENAGIKDMLLENLFKTLDPSRVSGVFGSVLGFTGNLLIAFFSIIFVTFFFLKEQGLFVRSLILITPEKYKQEITNIIDNSIRLLTRYFGGIVLQVTIITIFVSTCLGIAGVPNAILIAFFAALINVIPYVGPAIGGAFGIFIAISSNLDADFYTIMLPMIGKVAIVFGLMQMLDNFILQPYIFANSVLAHPLEIFIVILVGAKLGGITGMVLAIPVYTIIRVIAKTFLSEFHVVQKLTAGIGEKTG